MCNNYFEISPHHQHCIKDENSTGMIVQTGSLKDNTLSLLDLLDVHVLDHEHEDEHQS